MSETGAAEELSGAGPDARGVALVTGASGFLGSHLTDALVDEGWRVRALVRRTSSLRWLPTDRVELAYAALDDRPALGQALEGARVIFHLAGLTSAPSPSVYAEVNVEGTRRVIEAMRERSPGGLLVHCSSLAAAGPARAGRPLRESDPPRPIGPYGESKLAAEGLVEASGLDHVIVRPPAVYGPRDPDILTVFRLAAGGLAMRVGPPGQRLSLVHARDLAHGLLDAAEHGVNRGVFYMSDGAVHTWEEVVSAIGTAVGRGVKVMPVPVVATRAVARVSRLVARLRGTRPLLTPERARDLTQPDWTCDDARARAELGYTSAFGVEEGMRDTAEWYRANRWL